MKPYIPKQSKQIRERVEAKLDERLVRKLERYCVYLDSDRDYVLTQALELVFRKDKGFAAWLATEEAKSLATSSAETQPTRRGRPGTTRPGTDLPLDPSLESS